MRLSVLLAASLGAATLAACSPETETEAGREAEMVHEDHGDMDHAGAAGMDHAGMQPGEAGAAHISVESMAGGEAAPGVQTVEAQGQSATFTGAWIRTPPAGRDVAAGYVAITTAEPDAVLHVQSGAADRVELHTMSMDDNVMRMRRIERLETGSEPAILQPGGDHIMIFGLSETALASGAVELTFQFESGLTAEGIAFQIGSERPGQ